MQWACFSDHQITRSAYPPVRIHPHSFPLIPGDTRLISGDELSRGSCAVRFAFPMTRAVSAITAIPTPPPWPFIPLYPDRNPIHPGLQPHSIPTVSPRYPNSSRRLVV